jgi:hypothetical protein
LPAPSAGSPDADPDPNSRRGARPGAFAEGIDIGLWLGVVGPRAVRLVGAKADGWSVSATRLCNVMGLITPQDRDAFNEPVERWAETLTTLHTESQINAFVFWPTGDREHGTPACSPSKSCRRTRIPRRLRTATLSRRFAGCACAPVISSRIRSPTTALSGGSDTGFPGSSDVPSKPELGP